jgi:alpha-glucosidase
MSDLHWWQRRAIYQIYPRSFSDSNGDGVGDLRGIVNRLDYIDALGVGAIWLSPFYRSPMADFGYDVADYTDVDPIFGTLEDFDALVEEAHRRDIRVVVDWVPNHTSDQHAWFIESRSGRDSPKRDWYVWHDPAPDGGPPNRWPAAWGMGSAWTLDEQTGQYYLHSFLPQQPDLNWDNPDVEAAMHDVMRFWLRRGVDGFRIDVAQKIAKDPELGENEPDRPHDEDWPTIRERMRRIRAVAHEFDDRMLAGEVYILDLPRLVTYVSSGDELDLAHNFVFLHLPWDADAIRTSVEEFAELGGAAAWPAWFLSNHDHPRVASRFAADPATGDRRARVAAMLIATMRGTPFVYQGEELGLPDAEIPPDRVVDVDGRDPERAPMPWLPPSVAGPGAGFTTGEPWLPLVADAERLCVESQDADPGSTLAFVRGLLALRARFEALQGGAQRSIASAPGLFCFMREQGDERLLVALNFTSEAKRLELREDLSAVDALVELSTSNERPLGPIERGELTLEPDEGLVLTLPTSI